MKNAAEIENWPDSFRPNEWPENTLQFMSRDLFVHAVFPLRAASGIPMWPSRLAEAHVRKFGASEHSTGYGSRLSTATDMHVKTYHDLILVMKYADKMELIGGIGIYFDTNSPMFHIDTRKDKLMWIRTNKGEYIYREDDPVLFYTTLGKELQLTQKGK